MAGLLGRTASASLVRISSAPATVHENTPAQHPQPKAEDLSPANGFSKRGRTGELSPQKQEQPREAPPSPIPPTQLLQGAPQDPRPRRSRVPAKYLFSPSAEQVEVSCWKTLLPIERNKHKALSSD